MVVFRGFCGLFCGDGGSFREDGGLSGGTVGLFCGEQRFSAGTTGFSVGTGDISLEVVDVSSGVTGFSVWAGVSEGPVGRPRGLGGSTVDAGPVKKKFLEFSQCHTTPILTPSNWSG